MKRHSTAVPIVLPETLINEVLADHKTIVKASKKNKRLVTGDAKWRVTKPASIPAWAPTKPKEQTTPKPYDPFDL